MIVKKTDRLLLPWLLLSIPAVLFAICNIKGFDLSNLYYPYENILGPTWFLVCTFWCYLVLWCINEYIPRLVNNHENEWKLLLTVLISAFSWSMNYLSLFGHRVILPFFLSAAFTCMVFVGTGQYFKKWILDTPLFSIKNIIVILVSITICYAIVFLGGGKSFNPMWNETDQPVLYAILCAVFGSYLAIQFCRIIPNYFTWIGRNTISVLVIHYYPTQLLLSYIPDMQAWLRYSLVIMISLPLAYLVSKYLPTANGKGTVIRKCYE